MAGTIQIIVAGALLLAWIWVLGRPLLSGAMGRSDYRSIGGSYRADGDASAKVPSRAKTPSLRLPGFLTSWRALPVEIKRRQFMLATVFASFASFLLAIALRDLFVYLFLMMTAVLVVHILVAAVIGGRINEERHVGALKAAKSRVQATAQAQGMQIRARQVGDESFRPADELALLLAESPEATAEPVPVTSYVSDLITMEWGDEVTAASPAPESATVRVHLEGDEPSVEPQPEAEEVVDDEPRVILRDEVEPVESEPVPAEPVEDDLSTPEPIFTVAAKDKPARSRRKAEPIYIESQLDDNEGFPKAKAVNHP